MLIEKSTGSSGVTKKEKFNSRTIFQANHSLSQKKNRLRLLNDNSIKLIIFTFGKLLIT